MKKLFVSILVIIHYLYVPIQFIEKNDRGK